MRIRVTGSVAGIFALMVLCTSGALGQCEGGIAGAASDEGSNVISVSLTNPLNAKDALIAERNDQWSLRDEFLPLPAAAPSPLAPVVTIRKVERDPVGLLPITDLRITLSAPLIIGHPYRLTAPNLTFDGCTPKVKPSGWVTVAPAVNSVAPIKKPDYFPKTKSKGRDDSNVYLSGSIEGAEGGSPQTSADIKVDIPTDVDWGIVQSVGPYFDLKASTAKKADANALKFGVKLVAPFNIGSVLDPATGKPKNRLLRGLVWNMTGGFESDRRFQNINTVWGNQLAFVISGLGNSDTVYLQPFVGFELGRNVKKPIPEAEHLTLARPTVGGNLYIDLYETDKTGVSFQVDYIRRFLLSRETGFKEDESKKLILVPVGRGPRDYLKLAILFKFSDFTGMTIGYEYGSLPPNFELVRHKYSVGLAYKFQTKFIPK
jgi:hypothetical protein